MKLAMGKQRMLMVTQRVLIKRRRRRLLMKGLKCFMQLWHLVWVTLLSKDNIQMRKSMNEEGFESMFSQKLCGSLK